MILYQGRIEDSTIFFKNIVDIDPRIKEEYVKLKKIYENTDISEIKLKPNFQSHFEKQINFNKISVPFYMKKHREKHFILKKIIKILNFVLVQGRNKFYGGAYFSM